MHFVCWISTTDKQHYWHLKATNGEVIAHGEGYKTKADCLHAIELVMQTSKKTPVKELKNS